MAVTGMWELFTVPHFARFDLPRRFNVLEESFFECLCFPLSSSRTRARHGETQISPGCMPAMLMSLGSGHLTPVGLSPSLFPRPPSQIHGHCPARAIFELH